MEGLLYYLSCLGTGCTSVPSGSSLHSHLLMAFTPYDMNGQMLS